MKKITVFFTLLLMLAMAYSCGKPVVTGLDRLYRGDDDSYDASMVQTLTMNEIAQDPTAYLGTFIETEGKIISLCSVGCFFYIEDEGDRRFYVNLSPKNFDVPQSSFGQRVRVLGILERRGTTTSIIAYEVEFLDVNP